MTSILKQAHVQHTFGGDHWYIELPYAEHAAEELFGITSDQWEAEQSE